MNHDETVYKNPSTFDPDRYISKEDGGRGEPFPVAQFGFGRRICPGRYLAEANIWINVATLLASLEFRKVIGEDGMEITPDPQMTTGITSHPEPFLCRIVARSENVAELASRS